MRLILSILILLWVFTTSAQTSIDTNKFVKLVIVDSDTLPQIQIDEVFIVAPFPFKNKRQRRRYTRLVRDIKKVYPYAQLANKVLKDLEKSLDTITNKRLQKQHIKQADKALKKRYGNELKRLTIRQGRILIKLIDRETGSTSYELIKDLKGGFSAFMWQSLARLFGENLKADYDADGEDKMIEHILLRIHIINYKKEPFLFVETALLNFNLRIFLF